jgi:membrane protease YdiL (CAAX protease family)
LVFALSVPFYVIGALSGRQLTADLPVSSFIWVCPVIAASLLAYREGGTAGVAALLKRGVDVRRITEKIWYVPILVLPGIYVLTYGVMRMMGLPLPTVQFSLLAGLGWLVGYLLAAECEELGWTGYALDPLQERWTALQAGLILGAVTAAFHLVPLVQHGRPLSWIGWWTLSSVGFRILIVWIYNNTGRSVFAVTLFHALENLSYIGPFLDFGPGGFPLDAQRISALLRTGVAAIVVILWGPHTLTRFRLPDRGDGVLGSR